MVMCTGPEKNPWNSGFMENNKYEEWLWSCSCVSVDGHQTSDGRTVLICSTLGISRSVTVAAAYFMWNKKVSLKVKGLQSSVITFLGEVGEGETNFGIWNQGAKSLVPVLSYIYHNHSPSYWVTPCHVKRWLFSWDTELLFEPNSFLVILKFFFCFWVWILMLCAPSNRRRPFSYHTKMADFEYSCVLSVFSWNKLT